LPGSPGKRSSTACSAKPAGSAHDRDGRNGCGRPGWRCAGIGWSSSAPTWVEKTHPIELSRYNESREKNAMSNELWPQPRRRDVGVFSDSTLYIDALDLAAQHDGITPSFLQKELRPRLRALRLVRQQSASVVRRLVDELHLFGWLEMVGTVDRQRTAARARLTPQGQATLELAQTDRQAFASFLLPRQKRSSRVRSGCGRVSRVFEAHRAPGGGLQDPAHPTIEVTTWPTGGESCPVPNTLAGGGQTGKRRGITLFCSQKCVCHLRKSGWQGWQVRQR